MSKSRELVEKLFAVADVRINGDRPWDLQVADDRFYDRAIRDGTLGVGESYMLRWWDCADMDEFSYRAFRARLDERFQLGWKTAWNAAKAKLFNLQRRSRSEAVAKIHFNLSNEFYEYFLGKTMSYTCGYWKTAETLDEAQLAKCDLICRKLDLQPDDRVLEHGCGWGSFARYAAENYGCRVVAVSISEPQIAYAKELCRGFPVEAHYCDYRDERTYNPSGEKFDKVVSIGMCEHVGPKSYRPWFEIVDRQMKDDGMFLFHSEGSLVSQTANDAFTQKHVFPNSVIPSLKQLTAAAEGLFTFEDYHTFWMSYYYTLRDWQCAFADNWEKIQELDPKFDDRFYRMWNFYLFAGMGAIRARNVELWQIVFSKRSSLREYQIVR